MLLQKPEYDAALVGLVRLFSVAIAAVSMDKAGRKILLFVSGKSLCHDVQGQLFFSYFQQLCKCAGVGIYPHGAQEGSLVVAQLLSRGDSRGLDKGTRDHSLFGPMVLLHLSTAGVMLASNLTMGLYIHFVPSSQNGTITNRTLASSASPPAESINYITLIPLLATMFFIMGRCRG